MPPADTLPAHGLTPREAAKRYRVSAEKIRGWIMSGAMGALNLAPARCGKPRFVILPEHLTAFETARQAAPVQKATHRRKRSPGRDYYPDTPAEVQS